MFRIAVCDDSKEAVNQTCDLLSEFSKERKIIDLEVIPFTSSFDLIDAIEDGAIFNALIIETMMHGINGIQVSRMLREMKSNISIIFLTTNKSYALEAFEVSAAQYLIKGREKEALFKVLNQLYDPEHLERRKKVLLTAREGTFNIYMRDIMYVESNRNYQLIVMEDGTKLEVRITGKQLAIKLEENIAFKRCSSSYIINWFFLKSMTTDSIVMKDHTIIPIPRGHYSELKAKYEAFYETINKRTIS